MPGCFSNLGNDCPEDVGEMRILIVKMVLAPLNCVFEGPIRYFVSFHRPKEEERAGEKCHI